MKIKKYLPLIALGIVTIAVAGGAIYFYLQYQATQKQLQAITTDPNTVQKAAQEEVKKLVSEISKLIALPEGEDPTVATVSDIEKLKTQPFFQKAKNGDKVLIYTNAKKAILYDASAKKIIDVAPVNIGTSSAEPQVAGAQAESFKSKVALKNGTSTVGLTTRIENEIKRSIPSFTAFDKDNAAKNDYEKSLIIVFNDNAKADADILAKTLKLEVSSLPAGESQIDGADILVILGKDRT